MQGTTLASTFLTGGAGQVRPFARVLSQRLSELRIEPERGLTVQDFYARALIAIEAEASRVAGRPEVSVEEAFLAIACMASAPDLAKAIDRASRFYAAISRASGRSGRTSLQLHVAGPQAELRIYTAGPGPDEPATFMSALLGAAFHVKLFGWLIGEEINVVSAATSYHQLITQDALHELLPWQVTFRADLGPACDFRVTFSSRYLARPVIRTGSDIENLKPMDLLFTVSPEMSAAVAVRRIFLVALGRGVKLPSAARLAVLCNRSQATLRRHLARENTSVRAIRDDCVRARALQLLLDRSIPLADIASRLGFSDAPCFRRAFRRWTGSSPAAYRRKSTLSLSG